MIEVRCRLRDLLAEKNVTREELAVASGLPEDRIQAYCDEDCDSVSLREVSAILSALGCADITELFEEHSVAQPGAQDDGAPPMFEEEWHSPCPDAPDGRHRWYKDMRVSDTVYQEFTCQMCKRRLSVIL